MLLLSLSPWEQLLPNLDHTRSRYALGLFFIILQCIVWIAAAVITQYVYEENDDASPFLMTYIGMSLMAPIFLPIELWNDWRAKKIRKRYGHKEAELVDDEEETDACEDYLSTSLETVDSFAEDLDSIKTPYCLFRVMRNRTIALADQKRQIKPWNHKVRCILCVCVVK